MRCIQKRDSTEMCNFEHYEYICDNAKYGT